MIKVKKAKKLSKTKKAFAVFLLMIITIFCLYNVFAVDENEDSDSQDDDSKEVCKKHFTSNEQALNRYGLSVATNDSGKHYIVFNPTMSDASSVKKNIYFIVKEINGTNVESQNIRLEYNSNSAGYYAKKSDGSVFSFDNKTNDASAIYEVVLLKPEDAKDEVCTGEYDIKLSGEAYEPIEETISVSWATYTGNDTFDPDEYCKENSSEEICIAKANASNKSGNGFSRSSQKFQCDVNLFETDTKKLEGSAYYKNKKYLYYQETTTIDTGYRYVHHFAPYKTSSYKTDSGENPITCDITCMEGVKVEYGPPVASKAGLCFEYKVKVTSYTTCGMAKPPEEDKQNYNVCTPAPNCSDREGRWRDLEQGGPSEEFDTCVNKCDGGKYTKKCANKCYKEIYGSSSSMKTSSQMLSYQTTKLENNNSNLSDCLNDTENNTYGCYYWNGSSISWEGNGTHIQCGYTTASTGSKYKCDSDTAGRWYWTSGWMSYRYAAQPHYFVINDSNRVGTGFKRLNKTCQDNCYWYGCSSDRYLNKGDAIKDLKDNQEKYEKAVNVCKAQAKCSETTAEFSIAVDYKDSSGTTQTITFPYESIKKNTTAVTELEKTEGMTNVTKDKLENNHSSNNSNGKTLLSYRGCYSSTDNADNYYQAEWSFPGSWINLKTGEVTYKETTDKSGWRTMSDKFCIPLDAQDVNEEWWNYFYAKALRGNNSISCSSTDYSVSTTGSQKCYTKTDSLCKVDISKKFTDSVTYNIAARTVKFGYFSWDISVECFYALNSGSSNDCEGDDCNICLTDESTAKTRSVDLTDLFPSTDGTKTDTGTDSTKTGRTPGYNWSAYATISSSPTTITNADGTTTTIPARNTYYPSDPVAYLSEVQKKGYAIYDDEYLDYRIELTPSQLKKLKEVSNGNYTNYQGTIIDKNSGDSNYRSGVSRYKSSILRDSNYVSNAILPDDSILDCNNIHNHSDGCETFSNNIS